MSENLQIRKEFNVGDEFHVFAGQQLSYGERMVIGHAHEYDHLMVLLRPPSGPQPKYTVGYNSGGADTEVECDPYDLFLVKAGVKHWITQNKPGALGGFACLFSRRNADGTLRPDPKKAAG